MKAEIVQNTFSEKIKLVLSKIVLKRAKTKTLGSSKTFP